MRVSRQLDPKLRNFRMARFSPRIQPSTSTTVVTLQPSHADFLLSRAATQADRDFAAALYSAEMQSYPGKPRAHWMAIRLARKSFASCVLSILTSAAPVAASVT